MNMIDVSLSYSDSSEDALVNSVWIQLHSNLFSISTQVVKTLQSQKKIMVKIDKSAANNSEFETY